MKGFFNGIAILFWKLLHALICLHINSNIGKVISSLIFDHLEDYKFESNFFSTV